MSAPAARSVRSARNQPRYHPLVMVLVAVATGLFVDRLWPLAFGTWIGSAIVGLMVWLLVDWAAPRINARYLTAESSVIVTFNSFVLLLAIACSAGAWHHGCWYLFAADDLGLGAPRKAQPVCFEAVVTKSPRTLSPSPPDPLEIRPRGEASRFEAEVVAVRNGAVWQPATGRTTVMVQGKTPSFQTGDRIRCFAQLSAPEGPQNPGGFDYAAYLRSERILSRVQVESPECITVMQSGSSLSWSRLLDAVRRHSDRLLERHLDPRCAEVAEAVILGERNQMDTDRIEQYMVTGTIHLLVISGMQFAIVAATMIWLLRRLRVRQFHVPRGWMYLIVSVMIVLYMFLVDAGAPVVRATVLVLLVCAANYLGRARLSFNSLAAAAIVVLAVNPTHLFQVGAQLSFLCVAGLMWWVPRWKRRQDALDRLIERNLAWPEWLLRFVWHHFSDLMLISVMLWLLTGPLVMARFHLFTPVAFLVNAVVWLPMTCSLLAGVAMLVIGSVVPPLAHLFAGFCNWNLWFLELCVSGASYVPCGHFWVPGPEDWWLWGFYGGLGVVVAFPVLQPSRKWFVLLVAAWIGVGLVAANWPRHHQRLDCTFLNMGHGCAVFMELPSGQTVLYDAGRLGPSSVGTRTIENFLWSRGQRRIDTVVLSHPDLDHYNALPGLLDKFTVGEICTSPAMFQKGGRAIGALRESIERRHIPVRLLQTGDSLPAGEGCAIQVLHPPRHTRFGADNASSLVLSVEYQGHRILLPGDLESEGLEALLAEAPLPCDVLMAPHHGSQKSNSRRLAEWCCPRWVILSGDGRWYEPGAPTSYQAAGSEVLYTFERGAVQVQIDAGKVDVTTFVKPPNRSAASLLSPRLPARKAE